MGSPFQYRHQHMEPVEVDAVDGSAWRAEAARRGQALQLHQERPAPLERHVDDVAHLAQGAVLEKRSARIADFVHPAVAHLEDANLVSRAKAVLLAAEDAEALVTLTLEVQHRVDDMLEHPRAGDRALLVDVADQEDRDMTTLRQQHQPAGALPDLADAAGRRGDAAQKNRLDGVDDRHHRPRLFHTLDDAVQVVLGQDHEPVTLDAETLGSQLQLLDRLLTGDVEDRAVRARDLARQLQQHRRLSNPGIAPDQHQRPGNDAAPKHLVELSHPELEPVLLREPDLRQRHRLSGRDRNPTAAG